MPFLSVLTLLFVALKLTDFIDWSWWWITAPLWGIPVLALMAGAAGFLALVINLAKSNKS